MKNAESRSPRWLWALEGRGVLVQGCISCPQTPSCSVHCHERKGAGRGIVQTEKEGCINELKSYQARMALKFGNNLTLR